MNGHAKEVRLTHETFHPRVSPTGDPCPMGTFVELGADFPTWLAQSFKPAITKFFRHWSDVRIQSLTFNGETIFDYREWWDPPEPITLKVREANIPEWKERADAQ